MTRNDILKCIYDNDAVVTIKKHPMFSNLVVEVKKGDKVSGTLLVEQSLGVVSWDDIYNAVETDLGLVLDHNYSGGWR